MKIDKVTYIVTAAIALLPAIVAYGWGLFLFVRSNSDPFWLSLGLIFTATLGLYIGLIINPSIAYKRNTDICIGGIPFPVHYGMPIDDACISGYFSIKNHILR